MPVRILSWNIFKFGTHLTGNATRLNVVLDLVNPAAGPAAFDVFVVIEPQIGNGVRNTLATGSGPTAMWALRNSLRARTGGGGWEVVPPIVLANTARREAVAVFFNSATVTLVGPVDDGAITNASNWRTAATQGATPVAVGPPATHGSTRRGRVNHQDATPANIEFPTGGERRPYLVHFTEIASGNDFYLLAHHAPSPSYSGTTAAARNRTAREGSQQVGNIDTITAGRAGVTGVVVGDFNCCLMGHPDATCSRSNADQDGQAHNVLTGAGYTNQIAGSRSSLKTVNASTAGDYKKHAYDHVLTIGAVAVANARVVDLPAQAPGFGPGMNTNSFRKIFRRIRATGGKKPKGVSDHLPVRIDVTL